jgi:tRNA (guanine6-N2)-methyltransferase
MKRIFALTTRGLEGISGSEMAAIPGVNVTQTAYRRVMATSEGSLAPLLGLRTVDDVFIDVGTWPDIGHTRDMLKKMTRYSSDLDLQSAYEACAELRPLPERPTYSVTANFVGKRNYSTDEIKLAVADGVYNTYDWIYSADDSIAELNLRVFIEHETALVGVRLGQEALNKRPYKLAHLPGSLKPPVAAALVKLAEIAPRQSLLDPFCGSGTILVEAALMGAAAQGGDSDAAAVEHARTNLKEAGVTAPVQQWDARTLPLADASIDRIVSNLPWGRQVQVDAELESLYHDALIEMHRVLFPGGRMVILTGVPQFIASPALERAQEIEISLFGQNPTIVILNKAFQRE